MRVPQGVVERDRVLLEGVAIDVGQMRHVAGGHDQEGPRASLGEEKDGEGKGGEGDMNSRGKKSTPSTPAPSPLPINPPSPLVCASPVSRGLRTFPQPLAGRSTKASASTLPRK